ncbi:hypothetical protein FRC18_005408 [Serendipita sp. 400]|nr:hypothetical protein FRC18_005408 [Serendipita sp. 400]
MIRARSYLGYPPVRAARPNVSHYSLTALHHHGFVHKLITQNVDGLHSRSGFPMEDLLELHGTLFVVRCRHGHEIDRDEFQNILSTMNPSWKAFVDEMAAKGESLRTNPDGDVELEGRSYHDFVVPPCPTCQNEGRIETIIKPDIVFFGGSVPEHKKERSLYEVETANRFLVIATTMATYSAYRLIQLAHEQKKPTLILNLGPTRADNLEITKIELSCGEALKAVTKTLWYVSMIAVNTAANSGTSLPQDTWGKELLEKLDE